ncbi:5-oxoprolinase subunit PxpB [Blastochloris tepida]|uniref:Allophanate hydrolase n=1 Tax=Blastochloris tepida TaxID=2233851 RepID=A0A348FX54_9HYPH|nr:5-oxoprolinase subunit PxpB [Blastochloris tepida]BBF91887.1 allophanate hydrolase [Blastochloris tepida]
MRFLPSGDSALVVEFGDTIDAAVSARVTRLADRIAACAIPGVRELLPTFRSLMVLYDPLLTSQAELIAAIAPLATDSAAAAAPGRLWTIPVCYAPDLAPDLAAIAEATGLGPDEVVHRHAGTTYHVYMLGFLPGYPYLGDVDTALRLPRRTTPRTRLPAGSVGIAMAMTAIYPVESPGGWHLIGNTPVKLFDLAADPPALLAPGDRVRFRPIPQAEWQDIAAAVAAERFRLDPEPLP